jgi:hypothetical protein
MPSDKAIEIQRRRGRRTKANQIFPQNPIGVSLFLAVLQVLSRMKVLAYSHLISDCCAEKKVPMNH